MTTDDLDDTLGLEGAAKMLRRGLEAMKDLVDKGEVPAVRLNQKHTVILREDLIEFLRLEGRRQAAEQKKSTIKHRCRASEPEGVHPNRGAKAKPRRIVPPDLRAYEQS
ncbi:helix-turn-helix domain-containing protein [Stenotrophomonas maltophilia]|uniref:helix-turn-helix domain-containing protein n=1 Tax=Stenotrophomonas maltophilia TaxID=40324 RepID=UPI000B4DAC41|nr:helix-turn-helix domain-containing protein [Stenotrophomonas maltophilia]OWQ69545.1 hypothetical protein CEE57_13135 [Stenotrophomonas maltophilia]QGL67284.1 helix-turn-helix domain-containing protein [Stenotrophomonas maltophilia]